MPKKGSGTFNYPGGKTTLASWVIEQFPKHECYVEPFGGSGAVLFNKTRSDVEVYNDAYDRVVNFFKVARDRSEELSEWLEYTPYSRSLYEEYVDDLRSGSEPKDAVERAGRFFYIQTTSYSGKPQGGGFRISKTTRSPADELTYKFEQSKKQIDRIAERFRQVIIECMDYADVVSKYDGEDTLFYFDPPYVGDRNGNTYYMVGDDFDHDRFIETVSSASGYIIISYDTLPDGLAELSERVGWRVVERDRKYQSTNGKGKSAVERLVCNFDTETAGTFSGANQSSVNEYL